MASDIVRISIDELRAFIREGTAKPFDWVSCNCGFWVCEWIRRATGTDPVASVRGQFRTATGFRRFIVRNGGNEQFSRSIAAAACLEETDRPRLGDVGLVATGDGPTMAIKCTGDYWAAKSLEGVAIAPFGCIVAWSLR